MKRRAAQPAKRFSLERVRQALAAASKEAEKLIQRVGQAVESREQRASQKANPPRAISSPAAAAPAKRCLGCGTRLEVGKGYCAICGRQSPG